MITSASQTPKIKPNWNKKPLIRSKDFLENLSLKWLCDAITYLTWHSFLKNVLFSIRGVPMENKFLKLHDIKTKNL